MEVVCMGFLCLKIYIFNVLFLSLSQSCLALFFPTWECFSLFVGVGVWGYFSLFVGVEEGQVLCGLKKVAGSSNGEFVVNICGVSVCYGCLCLQVWFG